jgi:hypothetical protein
MIKRVFRIFIEVTNKFVKDSYFRDFCLYFPGASIYAACILIADQFINHLSIPVVTSTNPKN